MSASPPWPKLLKGALYSKPHLIEFQYNPETLSRGLAANMGDNRAQSETLRLYGPPTETIQMEIQLDATDRLELGEGSAAQFGITPQLAALEVLLYPEAARMKKNEELLEQGRLEVIPPESPQTFLIWGPQRVLPVRLTKMDITEELFDSSLNPLQAKVSLGMQVLTYQDLGQKSMAGALSLGQHERKEKLAKLATGDSDINLAAPTLPRSRSGS